jgi:hypothetical protein
MTPTPPEPSLTLRAPAWAFAPLALALVYFLALVWCTWAATGFTRFPPAAAQALTLPAAMGAVLALISIARSLMRRALARRVDIVRRAAIAFAIAGFVWPLSFALAIWAQGDSSGALSNAPHVLIGAVIGAIGGAIGGAAAAWSCFVIR